MKIRQLQYLLTLDQYSSLSAAAQEQYLCKSTLRAMISSIEKEIGVPLIYRTRGRIRFTPEGEEALALARDICMRFDAILALQEQSSSPSRPIPIAISPAINSALALPLTRQFGVLAPADNLDFQVMAGEKVGAGLLRNDNNIGVTYIEDSELKNFEKVAARYQVHVASLMTDSLYLMVRRDHPLARKNHVHCRDLTGYDFAMLPHFNTTGDSLAYTDHFGPNNRYLTFSTVSLIKRAVLEQGMITLLTGYAITHNHSTDNRQFKALRLSGLPRDNTLHLCLIHQPEQSLCRQEQLLIKCIRSYFSQLPPLPLSF